MNSRRRILTLTPISGAYRGGRPKETLRLLHCHESLAVQVFGRRNTETVQAL
jgi:hypothetical protein